jgi:hypothetical protein
MAGSWQLLKSQPSFAPSVMLLLTDGRVMCSAVGAPTWQALTPNPKSGSYVDGTWSVIAPMPFFRKFFASAVLADGRVIVAGGEYSGDPNAQTGKPGDDTPSVMIYDPLVNAWQTVAGPGWNPDVIGDAPCCVLTDGRLFLGYIFGTQTAIYDPKTNAWTQAAPIDANSTKNAEDTWTLLRDGSVLTVHAGSNVAERYVPSQNAWVSAGKPPVMLGGDAGPNQWNEIGPAILLGDGRVFALGATGKTALYSPDTNTWIEGPPIPDATARGATPIKLVADDVPACLLPNGHVLCSVGPPAVNQPPGFVPFSRFFEYAPEIAPPTGTMLSTGNPGPAGGASDGNLLVLPSGEVLYSCWSAPSGQQMTIYTASGGPAEAWRPVITQAPKTLGVGKNVISGKQLNGMSQAVSYGDDWSAATNYPLVRLRTADAAVHYCRTSGHTSMGVATGSAIVTTTFTLPPEVVSGTVALEVVANGIASAAVNVTISPCVAMKAALDAAVVHLEDVEIALSQVNDIGHPTKIPGNEKQLKAELTTTLADVQLKKAQYQKDCVPHRLVLGAPVHGLALGDPTV